MPGPSLISGVAGSVHSEAYQGPQLGEQMVQMAEAFTRIKQAQQASAQQKLKIMLDNVDKLPIDDKAIRKVAKTAGLPLGSDEHIAAIAAAGKQSKQQNLPTGETGKGQPMPQPTGAPSGGKNSALGADASSAKAIQDFQKNMTPEQAKSMVFETWAAKARQLSAARNDSEVAKAQLETKITGLRSRAMDGDGQAAGALMAAGEVPFNVTQLAWQNAPPEARAKMYDIAMGHESDAERAQRSDSIAKGLMQDGYSATDAYSFANTMAAGGQLSPEQQKKMGAPTFKRLAEEAEYMDTLENKLGVPADKAAGVAATAAITGSLVGALPKGLQSITQKTLDLHNRQLKVEERSIGVQEKQADTAAKREGAYEKNIERLEKSDEYKRKFGLAKLQLMEVSGQNKEYLDSLKSVIAMKKNGIDVDQKTLQKVLDGLKSNGVTDDPQGLMNYMTGQAAVGAPNANPVDEELGGPK